MFTDFCMFGMCFFCLEIDSFSTRISKNVTWLWAYELLFFPEGALVVNKCIQVGYAGVVQEKLERWPKIDWDQGIF